MEFRLSADKRPLLSFMLLLLGSIGGFVASGSTFNSAWGTWQRDDGTLPIRTVVTTAPKQVIIYLGT